MAPSKPISDKAVLAATGKSWDEWIAIINKAEAAGPMSHPELATYLHNTYGVSYWWSQSVANGYERRQGRRQAGQTADGRFQLGVSKTFTATCEELWDTLFVADIHRLWLGVNPHDFKLAAGSRYTTTTGITGEIRVLKPPMQLRMTYKPKSWENHSTLQIRLTPLNPTQRGIASSTGKIAHGDVKTTLTFHHQGLPSDSARNELREHWQAALKAVHNGVTQTP